MTVLDLTTDELLSTTRMVRLRLDLERPVARELLRECVDLAVQAPTGRNRQRWHFVIVTDPGRRRELADVWRAGMNTPLDAATAALSEDDRRRMHANGAAMDRTWAGLDRLYRHLHEVPALVVPCIEGRTEGASIVGQANTWGSILPAVWSFMLAARSRGLGTCWTGGNLRREREAAEVLGLPYAQVMQAALIPVAHTIGTDFRPARRIPTSEVLHWDAW
ncbi:nitroreductase family protein [Actinomadura nitritigenes]|uniref:nitroreductase family protein n=1 Tax=Actinomadura nitritigenes TaxID=134602 RepID=UPI003D8A9C1F